MNNTPSFREGDPAVQSSVTSIDAVAVNEMVNRFQQGDGSAFEFLYARYQPMVFRLCQGMVGNPAIAEELAQEAFLCVLRRLETFRGESAFATWLHRIAVNCVLMYYRKEKGRRSEKQFAALEPEDGDESRVLEWLGNADTVQSATLDRINLERAIDELPPGYRLVIILHDVHGYEHNEMAEMLGCSMGNTKSQLHKARLKLRRLLHRPESLPCRARTGRKDQPRSPLARAA
jgi:RNA polymerase sigma-70 factor (ECF subfamily)